MKKVIAILLTLALVLVAFAACKGNDGETTTAAADDTTAAADDTTAAAATNDPIAVTDLKVGVILVGDDSEGYTKAHMDGIKAAAAKLGIADAQITWKYKVAENSACFDAADELASMGCQIIFANSYGHQTFMYQAAERYKDITFVSMTGDFAAICGLSNLKNAFTKVYESRFVSGVVAGMKIKELVDNGTLTVEKIPTAFDADGNVKVGYVGAYNYAEVVSGYTAFYLGIKSVFEKVVMEVNYTNSWFDIEKEGASAEALLANGCVIIGQHADSTGAPAAVEKALNAGKVCYSVGYNIDMLSVAPNAALTSATNTWEVYYEYALNAMINGEEVATDWAEGYTKGAVDITTLGKSCAEGTQAKVDEVVAGLKDGTVNVFDTKNFTVKGAAVGNDATVDLSYYDFSTGSPVCVYEGNKAATPVKDGIFSESTLRSAPYFALRIDGITEDA